MESNCSNFSSEENFHASNAIMGSIGVVLCTVALIIAIASRFYTDIVQRLILYKLITVLVYYLVLVIIIVVSAAKIGGGSKLYIILAAVTGSIFYFANSVLTFWLTIILYLCIVHLFELRNFKKLGPVAVITSCIPFLLFLSFVEQKTFEKFNSTELVSTYIIGYSSAGLLNIATFIFVVIIIIVLIKKSRPPLQGQNNIKTESPLLNSNKWKALSKQLLPLVVYPIVNIIVTLIVIPLAIVDCKINIKYLPVIAHTLQASFGLITSIVVILHLVIVKCTKRGRRKRRRRKEWEESREALCIVTSNHNDVFTNETVASTDASTSYLVPRTTSLTLSQLVVN